jgi:hypothetical protein
VIRISPASIPAMIAELCVKIPGDHDIDTSTQQPTFGSRKMRRPSSRAR